MTDLSGGDSVVVDDSVQQCQRCNIKGVPMRAKEWYYWKLVQLPAVGPRSPVCRSGLPGIGLSAR
jgi:hypothetical protein